MTTNAPVLFTILVLCVTKLAGQFSQAKLDEVSSLRQELAQAIGPKVEIDANKQSQVDAIRNEIMEAVNSQKYKHGAHTPADNTLLASPLWHRIRFPTKILGATPAPGEASTEAIVDKSETENTLKFLGKFMLSSNSQRDVVELVSVHENYNFDYTGTPVQIWRTLPRTLPGHQHLLVGLTKNSLVLGNMFEGSFKMIKELKLPGEMLNLRCLETFLHWNNVKGVAEGYVILALGHELWWVNLGDKFDQLVVSWRWKLYRNVSIMKYYKHRNESLIYLSTGAEESLTGTVSATLDIYRYQLNTQEFAQIQSIRLPVPCKSIALVEWRKKILMALPLRDETNIYQFSNQQFSLLEVIPSANVTVVKGFQMGALSFFAIGGKEPKIMRFHNNRLDEIDVVGKSYQFVRDWVPLLIHTFRDDIILLVQYEVIFETHTLSVIGTLRWVGHSFETIYDVPCYMEDKLHYAGINCIIDVDKNAGFNGAIVLAHGHNISLLVPRHHTRSGLYNLKIEIRAAPHPQENKLIEIQLMFDYFSTLKSYSKEVYEKAQDTIKNAFLPNQHNTVTGEWSIGSLQSDELVIKEMDAPLSINGESWDENMLSEKKTRDMLDRLKPIVADVKDLEEKLEHAVLRPKDDEQLQMDGNLTVYGKININGMFNIDSLSTLASDGTMARAKRQVHVNEMTELKKLDVEELIVEKINGVPVEDMIFSHAQEIQFADTLEVDSLQVFATLDGRINNIDLNKDLVQMDHLNMEKLNFESIVVDHLQVADSINSKSVAQFFNEVLEDEEIYASMAIENLTIGQNLQVGTVNGLNWTSFASQLVLRQLPNHLPLVNVKGNVIFESTVSTNHLNGLNFPADYLWTEKDAATVSVITGHKTFIGDVVANSVDSDGIIDGVPIAKVISLTKDVYLPNETTFNTIEVLRGLQMLPTTLIAGPHLYEFLSNPTLMESKQIDAACSFRKLIVNGNVIVRGSLNGRNFTHVLSNMAYTDEGSIEIHGFKEFQGFNVRNLRTDLLNGKELGSFVTVDTDQVLNWQEFEMGTVQMDQIELAGLFDFVNVTVLNMDTIKLTGDQVTEAELIVNLGDNYDVSEPSLMADSLTVHKTINDIPKEQFLHSDNICSWNGDVLEAAQVHVNTLYLKGPLVGSDIINARSLTHYDAYRLSKSRDQQMITSPVVIHNLIVQKVESSRINSHNGHDIKALLNEMLLFRDHLNVSRVEEVHFNDDLHVTYLNDIDFKGFLRDVYWLNETNVFDQDCISLDRIHVENEIQLLGKLNGEDNFLSQVIWRNPSSNNWTVVTGLKEFSQNIAVAENLHLSHINSIAIDNLLNSHKPIITGPVTMLDNVIVHEDLNTTEWDLLKDFSVHDLTRTYSYNPYLNAHILSISEVQFNDPVVIGILHVGGSFNEIEDIQHYLNNIVTIDEEAEIQLSEKTFIGQCFFNDVQVKRVNGLDFDSYLAHAIMAQGHNGQWIQGQVQFQNIVEMPQVVVNRIVYVDAINNESVTDWMNNFASKDYDFNIKYLELSADKILAKNIEAAHLNSIPFDKFYLRHQDQSLKGKYLIENLWVHDIEVMGHVNGYKLPVERQNTLMTFGAEQIIRSPSIFESATVLNSLTTQGLVNNKNLSNLIPLGYATVSINSPLQIHHLTAKNLYTKHYLNGRDFKTWHQSTLKKYDPSGRQVVSGQWKVNNLQITTALDGLPRINDHEVTDNGGIFAKNKNQLLEYQQHLHESYGQICNQVQYFIRNHSRCIFKYFEYHSSIKEPIGMIINAIHMFNHNYNYYIIYSSGCISRLLKWRAAEMIFDEVGFISSGNVQQWIHIVDEKNGLYLVAKNGYDANCSPTLNNAIWAWNGRELHLVSQLMGSALTELQIGAMPGYFNTIEGGSVREYYAPTGMLMKEWPLAAENTLLRFIPHAAKLGLAVADGVNVYVLRSTPSNYRTKRSLRRWAKKWVAKKRLLLGDDVDNQRIGFFDHLHNDGKESSILNKIKAELTDKMKKKTLHFINKIDKHDFKTNNKLAHDEESGLMPNGTDKMDKPARVVGVSNETNPQVAGQLFDSIHGGIESAAGTFVDVAADVLEEVDEQYDLDEILGEREDSMRDGVNSGRNDKEDRPIVEGQLFDTVVDNIDHFDLDPIMMSRSNDSDSYVGPPPIPIKSDSNLKDVDDWNVQIAKEMDGRGIFAMANAAIPGRGQGEVLILNLVQNNMEKVLMAVTRNDEIFIYKDIQEQILLQTIQCHSPSSLLSLQLGHETLLVFLENGNTIQIYTYRGIMGFTKHMEIQLPLPTMFMSSAPIPLDSHCVSQFLALAIGKEVKFLVAETAGNCITKEVDCY